MEDSVITNLVTGKGTNLVTLFNVTDTRTGKFHPIAIVYEENAKYYVKAEEEKESTNNDSIL